MVLSISSFFPLQLISYSLPAHRYMAKNGLGAGSFCNWSSLLIIHRNITEKKSSKKKKTQAANAPVWHLRWTVVEFSSPHSTEPERFAEQESGTSWSKARQRCFSHRGMHTWLVALCKLFMVASVTKAALFFLKSLCMTFLSFIF